MNEYLNGGLYVLAGFIGATVHYIKKRYKDKTTDTSFLQYWSNNWIDSLNSIGNMAWAEVSLSLTGDITNLTSLVGALTLGYSFDSIFNKVEQ